MKPRAANNTFRITIFALALSLLVKIASAQSLVDQGAQSLGNRATPVTWITGHQTGIAWQSVIQTPHYQTDRDVGASSVGMGLLAAYDVTGNASYLQYAQGAGDFLIAAQTPANSGRWVDFNDPTGADITASTSFDDGVPGIADFLWRLYERTSNTTYKNAAIAGMDWEISKARAPSGKSCPTLACYWKWLDPADANIFTGMGQGVAGIAWTFDEFSKRLASSDPTRSAKYEQYAQASAAWLESQMKKVTLPDGSAGAKMPEQPKTSIYDTGFLNGSAGDAFFFYKFYKSTGKAQYLADANLLFAWVRSEAKTDGSCAGVKWPIQSPGNNKNATGVEEGNAGIGWVAIQASNILQASDPALAATDLQIARKAGDWLLSSCASSPEGGGRFWPEDEGGTLIHTSLDNGAPGIAVFLYDLNKATGSSTYLTGATAAQNWIRQVTFFDGKGAYWCENRQNGNWNLCFEPSWHWGTAGILDMAARLAGWNLDIPGEEPAP